VDDRDVAAFAEALIRNVRDRAIVVGDRLAEEYELARAEVPEAEQASRSVRRGDAAAFVPELVDEVLFEFLNALDNGDVPLWWRRDDGSSVPLRDLGMGEMAGWYVMGAGGWIDTYSGQRYVDRAVEMKPTPLSDPPTESTF
jgi:hypothetical protein